MTPPNYTVRYNTRMTGAGLATRQYDGWAVFIRHWRYLWELKR